MGPNTLPPSIKTISLFFMTVQVSECKKRLQWKRWKWGWWGKNPKTLFSVLLFWMWWMVSMQEALHCGDFSTLTVFGLKPRSGIPVLVVVFISVTVLFFCFTSFNTWNYNHLFYNYKNILYIFANIIICNHNYDIVISIIDLLIV